MTDDIRARHAGTCRACGGKWQPGDLIRPDEETWPHRWQHSACPARQTRTIVDALAGAEIVRVEELNDSGEWVVIAHRPKERPKDEHP